MTTAKRKHVAKLATAAPATPGPAKSFVFQCREAAMICFDGDAAAHTRRCADDLEQAVTAFTATVTAETMTHLNCMWVRAVRAYATCRSGPAPTPPTSNTGELDKAALAA